MSLTEKIKFCKDFAVLTSFDVVRTKGHLLGYSAEITGLIYLINAHDDPKNYIIGSALYVAGRACNNLRQQLKVDEKIGDDSHLLSVGHINELLEKSKKY